MFKNEQLQTTRFAHRLWISTTNNWGINATESIRNQNPPVTRLNLFDLIEAPVDWNKIEQGVHGETARTPKKTLGIQGPSGSGKTYSSLLLAAGLVGGDYSKVCIIDTEAGSSDLYSHIGS